jgi:hypothetical protein
MYTLLLEQQRAMLTIQFPHFSADVISKLENCVLSSRSMTSNSMLSHQFLQNAFDHEPQLESIITQQRKLIGVLLSLRLTHFHSQIGGFVDMPKLQRMICMEAMVGRLVGGRSADSLEEVKTILEEYLTFCLHKLVQVHYNCNFFDRVVVYVCMYVCMYTCIYKILQFTEFRIGRNIN